MFGSSNKKARDDNKKNDIQVHKTTRRKRSIIHDDEPLPKIPHKEDQTPFDLKMSQLESESVDNELSSLSREFADKPKVDHKPSNSYSMVVRFRKQLSEMELNNLEIRLMIDTCKKDIDNAKTFMEKQDKTIRELTKIIEEQRSMISMLWPHVNRTPKFY